MTDYRQLAETVGKWLADESEYPAQVEEARAALDALVAALEAAHKNQAEQQRELRHKADERAAEHVTASMPELAITHDERRLSAAIAEIEELEKEVAEAWAAYNDNYADTARAGMVLEWLAENNPSALELSPYKAKR